MCLKCNTLDNGSWKSGKEEKWENGKVGKWESGKVGKWESGKGVFPVVGKGGGKL